MATISTLAVNLIARTGTFERKMKKSRRQVTFFRKQVALAGRAALRFGAGLLAVAGPAVLGYLIIKTLKSIDATAKLAASLDISTEALKGLELAAKITGAELTTITKGIEIMVRRLGEAKLGIGEAKRALETMGLSVDDLIAAGTEEAFKIIAEEISKIPAAANRAVTAYMIFGRQGVKLLNLFKDGRKGIEAFRKEAEKLGITFSAVDASRVEAANDAIARAQFAIQGIIQDLTIELAPLIESISKSFTDWATESKALRENIIGIIKPFITGMAFMKDLVDVIGGSIRVIVGIVQGALAIIVIGIGQIIGVVSKNIGGMIQEVGKELEDAGLKNMEAGFKQVGAGITGTATFGVADFYEKQERAAARLAAELEKTAAQRVKDAKAMAIQKIAAEVLAKQFDQGTRIATQMATPIEKYNATLTQLNELAAVGAITQETFNRALAKATTTVTGKLFDLTPMEQYEAQITKINDMVNAGVIGWKDYGRAVRDAREKLEGTVDAEKQFQGAGQFEVIRRALVSVTGLDSMAANPELTEAKKQTRLLERIADKEMLS